MISWFVDPSAKYLISRAEFTDSANFSQAVALMHPSEYGAMVRWWMPSINASENASMTNAQTFFLYNMSNDLSQRSNLAVHDGLIFVIPYQMK
eukprot:m.266734 g.266734  ORF g.266734 m.266734 type:complete len:93 (+) comp19722_c2_seq1:1557-1835(+)